jgi:hypothetical protein
MLYQVDYLVKDQEKYKADGTRVPKYVVGTSFEDVLEKAKTYESENLSLYEAKVVDSSGILVTTENFKGEL